MKQLSLFPLAFLIVLSLAFINPAQAQPFAEPIANPFGLIAPESDTLVSVRLVDIDNDGLKEAFVATLLGPPFIAIVDYYEFDPQDNGVFEFVESFPFNMPTELDFNIQFADIDGDDDYDLFYNQLAPNGHIGFAENIGSPEAPSFDAFEVNPFGMVMAISPVDGDAVDFPYPSFADIDDDGDLDIFMNGGWLNNLPDEQTMFYENTGTDITPIFGTPVLDTFGLSLPVTAVHLPELVDLDCDGDLDLFINIGGSLDLYYTTNENASNPAFSAFEQDPWNTDNRFVPAFGSFTDFDGDGDLDLLCGGRGNIYYFENLAPEPCDYLLENSALFLESKVQLFPNPTSDFLRVEFESEENVNQLTVSVHDIVGKQIKNYVFNLSGNFLYEDLTVKDLADGIYILRIATKETFIIRKFVKVK